MGLGYPQLRRLLRELGRRLVAGGAVAQPEDIYWLEAQEVDELAAALENGAPLPNFSRAGGKPQIHLAEGAQQHPADHTA